MGLQNICNETTDGSLSQIDKYEIWMNRISGPKFS